MKFERSSGILLHPTSLPGSFGIGDLGPSAYQWVDWLAGSGCTLWQVLPLGPTGFGDSPYQCFSAFAGNPYLISPDFLLRDDLLHSNDLVETKNKKTGKVNYGSVIPWKLNLLERAYVRFTHSGTQIQEEYSSFCNKNSYWLEDYSLFMAIKESRGGGSWQDWGDLIRKRDPETMKGLRERLKEAVARHSFYQFLFFRQWQELLHYAHKKGLMVIGDIPIFVAIDSSDVWSHPELFCLDNDLHPTVVAGVPPDYFSPTGQLWGNPLYLWEAHRSSGYQWWLERLSATLKLVDILRIDHFRGFAGYWEIPAGKCTAEVGCWKPGPGQDFFSAIQNRMGGEIPILAEDLGVITPDVVALRDQFGFPGMKILQFAFSGPDNPFLPHQYSQNCVVYTGTHDNDTAVGWFKTAPEMEKAFALRYLKIDGSDFARDLIREAWSSTAVYALAPMQDLLRLDTFARFNYPSRLGGNWEWRMDGEALSADLQSWIRDLNWLYGR